MVSGAAFDRCVQRIDDCIEESGDEIVDAYYSKDDATRTVGYDALRGGWVYQILGTPGHDDFRIRFPFDITNNISDILTEEDAESILSDLSDPSVEADKLTRASIAILDDMDPELMSEFEQHLISTLMDSSVGYNVDKTEEGSVVGFTISRPVYPADDGFSLTEFSHSVQAVITTGIGGVQFINSAFQFEDLIEGYTTPDPIPRYLQ